MRKLVVVVLAGVMISSARVDAAEGEKAEKKVILIAGKKSHGPGFHEYEKGVKLFKYCLDHSPNVKGLKTEVVLNGWPEDPSILEGASTILMYCDGSDHSEADHPILQGDRLKTLDRQMSRGVGFVAIHYTVFVPVKRGGPEFLRWIGGYFDYESGSGTPPWFSKIGTHSTRPNPVSPAHPISRGLHPFALKEEYYYNILLSDAAGRLTPILTTEIPGEASPQDIAWAFERASGGRGFGLTGGHFHSNWKVEEYRKMVLNAILWTAGAEVPPGGVESTLPDGAEF